ncbi:hypothetical protein Q0N30_10650 [Priestia megaterium]|uniref:hypothetical protein n=1 Tax=Priestia megaterium TaxID=1404 RepID=UPI0034576F92
MTKVEARKAMHGQLKVIEAGVQAVESKLAEIKDVENQAREELKAKQEELQIVKNQYSKATDLTTIKELHEQVEELEKGVLLLGKLQSRATAPLVEQLGDIMEPLIKVNQKGFTQFKEYERTTIMNTSLASVEEDMNELLTIIKLLERTGSFIKRTLLKYGLMTPKDYGFRNMTIYTECNNKVGYVRSQFQALRNKF